MRFRKAGCRWALYALTRASMPYIRPIPDGKPRSKASVGLVGLVQAEKLMQIALVLPSGVLIGWLIGAWLASHLHQSWLVLVGLGLGAAAGMLSAVRMAMSSLKDLKPESKNGNGAEKGNSDTTS